jgi:hypothetical protein
LLVKRQQVEKLESEAHYIEDMDPEKRMLIQRKKELIEQRYVMFYGLKMTGLCFSNSSWI